ncbi:hypothetical protein ACIRU3_04825 [Streptomyces sp. NPDC101151]|uniref:hypothetical protein n=1 Tax=Streptomyces sp. NPDC101151 TaxID=3366115 RepID=UPI003822D124
MFSRKKIAAVSGLLGGLAVTCTGITQAYAGGGPGICTRDLQGNVTCIQRIEGELSDDGGFFPHQENCLPTQPFTLPAPLGNGKTRIGPEVTCSDTKPAGDKADSKVELPGLLG